MAEGCRAVQERTEPTGPGLVGADAWAGRDAPAPGSITPQIAPKMWHDRSR